MDKPEVFKFHNLSPPVRVHVFSAYEKEERVTVADELYEVIEPSFKHRGVAPGVVAEIRLFALETKTRRGLDILGIDRK